MQMQSETLFLKIYHSAMVRVMDSERVDLGLILLRPISLTVTGGFSEGICFSGQSHNTGGHITALEQKVQNINRQSLFYLVFLLHRIIICHT